MRRKRSPAEERTIGLFTGKTNEELAREAAAEEEALLPAGSGAPPLSYDDAVLRGYDLVQQETIHDGEDILLLQHPTGGVMMVATQGPKAALSHYLSVFLTKRQVQKLRTLL